MPDEILHSVPVRNEYKVPQNPVVLCHGLSGFDKLIFVPSIRHLTKLISNGIKTQVSDYSSGHDLDHEDMNFANNGLLEAEYWIGIKKHLESKGCKAILTKVPGWGSIEERALTLNAELEKACQEMCAREHKLSIKLNLIAHSMGGLDCRYLISNIPKRNYQVITLTTICSPHKGSEVADYIVENFHRMQEKLDINKKAYLPTCFYQLTTYFMGYYNTIIADDPNVAYFSYGSYFKPKWYSFLKGTWSIIDTRSRGQLSDGLVTVKSSHWGTYLGTLPNVDHLDIINWQNRLMNKIGQKFLNQPQPIDILNFYLHITDDLARRGY